MTNIFSQQPEIVVKTLTKRTLVLGSFLLIMALLQGEVPGFLGLIFGLAISLLLFRLKLVNSRKALQMEPAKAEKFIRNRTLVNLLIYFVVLAVAMNNAGLSFVGAVLGLLLLKFVIIGSALIQLLQDFLATKKNKYQEYDSSKYI